MQDVTLQNYNAIMNMLFHCADMYNGLKYAFKHHNFKGFYKFAGNESHERWCLGDSIAKYIVCHGRQPNMTIGKAFPQEFQSVPAAIDMMIAKENEIVNEIQVIIDIHTTEKADLWTVSKLSEIYEKCQYEMQEVKMVKGKVALPGADLFSVDTWLYEKYK